MAKKIKERNIPRFISPNDFPKYVDRREFIEIGKVYKNYNYITISGQKQHLAKRFFSIMVYLNQLILSISFISIIVLFNALQQNESPTLFANFKNGKLMCSNEPINIYDNDKSIGRESQNYINICHNLEKFESMEE